MPRPPAPRFEDEHGVDEWHRPENWHGGWLGIYVAPRDARVMVRARPPRIGWTFNFARPASWVWLAAMLLLPVAILAASSWFGAR